MLLANIFLGREISQAFFDSLSPHNLCLLKTLIPKIFKISRLRLKLDRDLLNALHLKPSTLKPEQKLKLVFRQVFRNLFRGFAKQLPRFREKEACTEFEDALKCPKKAFYLWLFRASVLSGRVSLDVVMDVVCNNSWQNKRGHHADWRTIKVEALKQMSAPLRFLISSDENARSRVLAHLDDTSKHGFFAQARAKIERQLLRNLEDWRELLEQSGADFKVFRKKLRAQVRKSNKLFPWTLSAVQRAINFCKWDMLQNRAELQRKFEKMLVVTYPPDPDPSND